MSFLSLSLSWFVVWCVGRGFFLSVLFIRSLIILVFICRELELLELLLLSLLLLSGDFVDRST